MSGRRPTNSGRLASRFRGRFPGRLDERRLDDGLLPRGAALAPLAHLGALGGQGRAGSAPEPLHDDGRDRGDAPGGHVGNHIGDELRELVVLLGSAALVGRDVDGLGYNHRLGIGLVVRNEPGVALRLPALS
jgi:hypothetical protein